MSEASGVPKVPSGKMIEAIIAAADLFEGIEIDEEGWAASQVFTKFLCEGHPGGIAMFNQVLAAVHSGIALRNSVRAYQKLKAMALCLNDANTSDSSTSGS